MLTSIKMKLVEELISTSTKEELIWLNGYLNGIVAAKPGFVSDKVLAQTTAVKRITFVFGTETGNAKKISSELAAAAKKKGLVVKLSSLEQYRLTDLSKEEYFFIVISTHGEGEPPASAKPFFDHIQQDNLLLPNLRYSVLALGDTSYPLFCKAGEDADVQLEKQGGKRIIPLQKCDVDFEEDARQWFEKVLSFLEKEKIVASPAVSIEPKKTGKKFYEGKVITNINLNDRGSEKETYHIEIAANEIVDYEPGDSLAIIPHNRKEVVDEIIKLAAINPITVVETGKISGTIEDLLTRHLNICYLLSSTVKKYAAITAQQIPDVRMDLKDLLRIYPVKEPSLFTEIIKILNPIAPRLYSISSSPAVHADEVHITVGKHRFFAEGEERFGLCSEFLGVLPVGTELKFYIHKNRAFKLPAPEKDIILIGPGTGIAALRSFLAQRDATAASGKNWLFFGEQHFTTDFLYQTEIQQYLQTGVLSKISLAFSRDQQQKIYVQHRIKEHSQELVHWISAGAFIYISGGKQMGADVEATLTEIIGEAYVKKLKTEGRLQKDVY